MMLGRGRQGHRSGPCHGRTKRAVGFIKAHSAFGQHAQKLRCSQNFIATPRGGGTPRKGRARRRGRAGRRRVSEQGDRRRQEDDADFYGEREKARTGI